MPRATWNGAVVADSEDCIVVEGNQYFPREDVDFELLEESKYNTICPWKGEASYFHVVVDGEVNENAAWYYPDATDAAKNIEGRIAFWRGVEVTD